MKESIDRVRIKAKACFENAGGCHDWTHVERVLVLCNKIGAKEGADLQILELAALLHDVGRKEEDDVKGEVCHAEIGAKKAAAILKEEGFDESTINAVVHCIECHRYRKNKKPESLEAKVLFDADKLDSIGAIGIARDFLFAGEIGAKLHAPEVDVEKQQQYSEYDTGYREFLVKLRFVKDRILTAEGKRMAEERHNYMVEFFNRLNEEVEGKL
ncbi:MAG: HD domain-containing protein [Candidatus Micrarchaeota archaeon]